MSVTAIEKTTPVLLDSREVAALLGVSKKTVERLASQGQFLRPVAVGRLRKWQRAAVLAWVEQQQHG